ncbi:hypothetical protein GKJPGBOP_04740 [Streptomyces paromomycinus]|uniref:Uncharacterized protein n=1 Tax=Streptomyces paromomycinus TaxID=92743 RepID=A0A401W6R3_STREY|nr:hypothetical protein GKJPGBOP_04740 [Streptomyces paromomycinus]
MPRMTLLEPPYADRGGALLARMMPGGGPPVGPFRMFAGNFPMTGAIHGWGRYGSGGRPTPLVGGRHA